MSTKKGRGAKLGRGAKVLTVPQHESQKGSSNDQMDSPNLSAIERGSFLEGLQQNYGNPMHSTAMSDDLNISEEGQMNRGKAGTTLKTTAKQRGAAAKRKETIQEGQMNRGTAGRKEIPKTLKTTAKQRGAAAKRKETDRDGENEEEEQKKKKSRRSTGGTSAARQVKSQQVKKGRKRTSDSGSGVSSEPETQEKSDTDTTQQSRHKVLSFEEEEEEDGSWRPSPKKAKVYQWSRTRKSSSDKSESRKSSSGRASAGAEKSSSDQRSRKTQSGQGGTELEVVLDAFLEFCDQNRDSVESKAVKRSIDSFSSNVKEQLLEKISSSKELKVLKRQNAKVGSLIRTKTQRLLDAKQELMRAERQLWLLQKEKAELKVRLADLRRGQAFLHDIKELNRQYLDYRRKHPKEKETYGASSLPALLLKTKYIQAAEHQLRGINNNPQKRQKKNDTRK